MEGGSNSTCIMPFGNNTGSSNSNNNGGLCSLMNMMPPTMTSHHHPNSASSNSLFHPLTHQDLNHNSSSGSSMIIDDHNRNNNTITATGCYFMDGAGGGNDAKAKIMAHPHYPRLLVAYANCQKVGAPPDVVVRLEEACASAATMGPPTTGCIGEDPALDQFMEAYCEMLTKYEQELSKPFKEAMLFLQRIECQFKSLTLSSPNSTTGEW